MQQIVTNVYRPTIHSNTPIYFWMFKKSLTGQDRMRIIKARMVEYQKEKKIDNIFINRD